ncbi:MAG TPA: O-antigen ligase family protein [Pyrinomonadaceae bacterium]|nr:O-antigen ligase family protein [Pyrinomonadaceae bacterium]
MTWASKLGFVLLAAIIVFTTIAYGTVHQPVLLVFYVLVSLMAVLWAADAVKSKAVRFSTEPVQLVLLAAALYGLVQVIPFGSLADTAGVPGLPRTISLEPFATKVSALHYFALFMMLAFTIVLLDSASRIRKIAIIITIFGFAYAFFAILQSVLSPKKIYGLYEASLPFGSFVNRHNFAAYMEMTMAVPLGLLFVGAVSRDKRLLYGTAIGLMGVALLLSGSRGGLVAFVAEIIFLALLTAGSRSRRKVGIKLALAGLLLAAMIGGAVFVGGETSLSRVAESTTTQDVTTGRSHIWQVTLKVIAANMPFGAGFGAFGVAYTPFDSMSGLERVEQSHNDYLQVLADAGLVGLAIGAFLLWCIFVLGRQAFAIENRYRRGIALGALAGMFAIFVHSVFDFVLHTTAVSVLFLTLLAILVAARRPYEDDVEDAHHDRRARRSTGSVKSISSARRRSSSH